MTEWFLLRSIHEFMYYSFHSVYCDVKRTV